MENVFYLFPVKEGLPGSYAHPVLQRSEGLDDEDVLERLREICSIDDDLQYATVSTQLMGKR